MSNEDYFEVPDFEDKKEQPIVVEYKNQEEKSKLKQCIEEETSTDDIEWFFYNNQWCYFEEKEIKDKEAIELNKDCKEEDKLDEYKTVIRLVCKKKKKFGKNCEVNNMSFVNFMYLSYLEYIGESIFDLEDVEIYIDKYQKQKDENSKLSIQEFNKLLDLERKQMQEKTNKDLFGCFCWTITIVLLLFPKIRFLAIFTCPLTYIFIEKITGKTITQFFNRP